MSKNIVDLDIEYMYEKECDKMIDDVKKQVNSKGVTVEEMRDLVLEARKTFALECIARELIKLNSCGKKYNVTVEAK